MISNLVQNITRYPGLLVSGAGVVTLVAVFGLVWWQFGRSTTPAATSVASYRGTALSGPAPDFRLVDQNGSTVALSDLRGMVVVLTLLDPDCTDICPIYAYHFRLAYQALGKDAAKVAFLAFNANNEKTAVEDVMAATRKWQLDEIPTWHFLTGSPEELQKVWDAYGLLGSGPLKPDKPGEKQHSPAIFVIDQNGEKRWFGSTAFEGAPPPSDLIVEQVRAVLAKNTR